MNKFLSWLTCLIFTKAANMQTWPSKAHNASVTHSELFCSQQINCFFLVWLLRVLCIKAASTTISSPSRSCPAGSSAVTSSPTQHHLNGCNSRNYPSVFTRQSILISLRAAVLLLPLYGLHYLLIVYRPKIE